MRVSSRRQDGWPLVVVSGEIDHGSSASLQTALDVFLEAGDSIVLLDLTAVTYIDSGGISVILATVRRLRAGGWLGAVNPNPNVRRLLEIVGLSVDNGFRVFADAAAAAAAAGGASQG
ncbi:MAG: STAS domain-containing protein [Thermoleophilia bacterium]